MGRSIVLALPLLLLGLTATAQQTGSLTVTVQRVAEMGSLAGPVAAAKVFVVHWTNSGGHASMVQDQVATTNQKGMCSIDLPPGTYDLFVAASDLAPAAFRREIKAGEAASLTAHLPAAPLHLRPVE